MVNFSATLGFVLAATLSIAGVSAAPQASAATSILQSAGVGKRGCSLAGFQPALPAGQTTLVAPPESPSYVGIAFGVQNYTCSDAGTYTAAGALAELLDASCLVKTPQFKTATQTLFRAWNAIPMPIATIIDMLHKIDAPEVQGQHYFVPNPVTGTGLSPLWDFRSSGVKKFRGDPNGILIGKPAGSIPAPTDPSKDVAWLNVEKVQGNVASRLFRVDTVGGQPPASCTPGQTTSVKYTANYVFYA